MKVRPGYGLEPLPTFTCTKYNQDRAGQISTQSAGTVWKEPVAVVTAKCNSDTSPPDVYMGEPAGSCLADDAANARGILKKNFFKDCSRLQQLGVTAFRAASGSVKEYLYVYDFGAEDTVQALELVGWSSGHWAEDRFSNKINLGFTFNFHDAFSIPSPHRINVRGRPGVCREYHGVPRQRALVRCSTSQHEYVSRMVVRLVTLFYMCNKKNPIIPRCSPPPRTFAPRHARLQRRCNWGPVLRHARGAAVPYCVSEWNKYKPQ